MFPCSSGTGKDLKEFFGIRHEQINEDWCILVFIRFLYKLFLLPRYVTKRKSFSIIQPILFMKRTILLLILFVPFVSCTRDVIDASSSYTDLYLPESVQQSVATLTNGLVVVKEGDHYRHADMLFPSWSCDSIKTRGVTFSSNEYSSWYHFWPNRTVYYKFAPSSPTYLLSTALSAMNELSDSTGVRFVEATSSVLDYVLFKSATRNASYVGKLGGEQEIELFNYSMKYKVMHEIMHALGFFHEHERVDRFSFIEIKTNNIWESAQYNFSDLTEPSYYDVGSFNFESIMLYGSMTSDASIAIDTSLPIITKLDGSTYEENRSYLSAGDVETIKNIYGPPFHRLEEEIDVWDDHVSGIEEVYDGFHEWYLRFYEDEACTIPTTIPLSRRVMIETVDRELSSVSTSYSTIIIPAGVSSYYLGSHRNQEIYFNSDPYIISYLTKKVYEPTHVPSIAIYVN